jgi:hypothetical protein
MSEPLNDIPRCGGISRSLRARCRFAAAQRGCPAGAALHRLPATPPCVLRARHSQHTSLRRLRGPGGTPKSSCRTRLIVRGFSTRRSPARPGSTSASSAATEAMGALCVPADGRLAGGAKGSAQAHDLLALHREQAERDRSRADPPSR